MSDNTSYVLALAILFIFLGSLGISAHWEKIETDNNAFAEKCNANGGVVERDFDMRQCIRAKAINGGGNG